MGKKTNKTEHVLKLLTGYSNNEVENPILNEDFKNEKIHSRHNSDESYEPKNIPINVKVDVLKELVKENIDSVIERFNICGCDECKNEIIINSLREITPVYIDVVNNNYEEVKKQKNIYRQKVVTNLVKNAIKLKTNNVHNKH